MRRSIRSTVLPHRLLLPLFSCFALPYAGNFVRTSPPVSFACEWEDGPARGVLQRCFFARLGFDLAALGSSVSSYHPALASHPLLGEGQKQGICSFQFFPDRLPGETLCTVLQATGFASISWGFFIVTNMT